jgi:hypothetical protein
MRTEVRLLCLPVAALAAVGLSACGSSSTNATPAQTNSSTSAASSSTPSPSPTPSLTPSPTPSSTLLTKAEFVAKMDAVCVNFTAKLQQLPEPMDEQDVTSIAANLEGTLRLFPQYMKQAESLVSRAADEVTLRENWLTVEKSDFRSSEPAFKRFIADVKAKRQDRLQADFTALQNTPDHSEAIAGFMSGYGLKSCAILERL